MPGIPPATHRFRALFEADDTRILRITLRDEDILRLRCFGIVDPSIYGIPDQWSADVVEPISGKHPNFHRLFHAGSGVDFVESDISEIADDDSGVILYQFPRYQAPAW